MWYKLQRGAWGHVREHVRYIDGLSRQLDTSPKFRELPDGMRALIRRAIAEKPLVGNLKMCETPADLVEGILRTSDQLSGEVSQRMGNEIMIDPADLV